MFRPQPISSTDARKHFTNLIKKVSFSSKSFVIQSYHQSLVRLVNENYIRVLEEVIGKKTVNQVMQIAGDERLFESEKMERIKKTFQRRLSGSPRQQSHPKPQSQVQTEQTASPSPKPQPTKPQKQTPKSPSSNPPQNSRPQKNQKTKRPLLLANGKNYK
jgi:Mg-chelatase subunit ChlI